LKKAHNQYRLVVWLLGDVIRFLLKGLSLLAVKIFDCSLLFHTVYIKDKSIVYHAWDTNMEARRMCLDQLLWTPSGPRCEGPTWTPQTLLTSSPSGT
ncbi:MAG TPA: hypothetical protein V6C93_12245, partial [Allocoleopsis sp.]